MNIFSLKQIWQTLLRRKRLSKGIQVPCLTSMIKSKEMTRKVLAAHKSRLIEAQTKSGLSKKAFLCRARYPCGSILQLAATTEPRGARASGSLGVYAFVSSSCCRFGTSLIGRNVDRCVYPIK